MLVPCGSNFGNSGLFIDIRHVCLQNVGFFQVETDPEISDDQGDMPGYGPFLKPNTEAPHIRKDGVPGLNSSILAISSPCIECVLGLPTTKTSVGNFSSRKKSSLTSGQWTNFHDNNIMQNLAKMAAQRSKRTCGDNPQLSTYQRHEAMNFCETSVYGLGILHDNGKSWKTHRFIVICISCWRRGIFTTIDYVRLPNDLVLHFKWALQHNQNKPGNTHKGYNGFLPCQLHRLISGCNMFILFHPTEFTPKTITPTMWD